MSEQITVALPNDSTEGKVRTMALDFTKRFTPIANTTVEITCKPSGIAATAKLTAIIKVSKIEFPYKTPTTNINAQIASAA